MGNEGSKGGGEGGSGSTSSGKKRGGFSSRKLASTEAPAGSPVLTSSASSGSGVPAFGGSHDSANGTTLVSTSSVEGKDEPLLDDESLDIVTALGVQRLADASEKPVTVDDFDLLKVIGKGSFGKVFLVRKKGGVDDGSTYAMKALRKDVLLKRNQIEHTKTERAILESVDHPFIVCLRYAFQSKEKLYLVTGTLNVHLRCAQCMKECPVLPQYGVESNVPQEHRWPPLASSCGQRILVRVQHFHTLHAPLPCADFASGGELFFWLKRERVFSQGRARLYAAELVLALEHLHSLDIVYRYVATR